jgi:transposase
MPNFREYDQRQGVFRQIVPNELLDEDHPARIVDAVVERLDLSELYATYSEEGNPPYHPKMMLKVLFYSYLNGMMSCRKMWEGLKERADYIFLSGDQVPDFRTVNRFRAEIKGQMVNLFAQIVVLCVELEMVDFRYLGIDGQKIQANASFRKSMDKRRWEEKVKRVEKLLEKLKDEEMEEDRSEETCRKREAKLRRRKERLMELEPLLKRGGYEERAVNISDADAKVMSHKDGRKLPSYNHQSAVDGKLGVTVAVETRTDAFDHGNHLFPLVEQARKNTGRSFENVLADSGFCDFERLQEVEEQRSENYYMPDRLYEKKRNKSEKRGDYGRSHFIVAKNMEVRCPKGHVMKYRGRQKRPDEREIIIFEGTQCGRCLEKQKCTAASKRTISVDTREPYRQRMQEKLDSDEGREIYMKRQGIVEPIHGHEQKNLGWIQHHLRGESKAKLEFLLIRTAGNIGKICRYRAEKVLALA